MFDKLGRKITIVAVLVIASLVCLLLPDRPFRLGLDLHGGTRLVYRFDFERALREGKISQAEFGSKTEMLQNFANILRNRVDPTGVMELAIRPEGEDRIVIELPGVAELSGSRTTGALAVELGAGDMTLQLDESNLEILKAFSPNGGVVLVGGEKIQYSGRMGATLTIADRGRGFENTLRGAHAAGVAVELLTNDDLQRRIENVGDLQFLLAAKPEDAAGWGFELQRERQRVDAWIAAHPTEPIERFNDLPPDQGGPPKLLRWYPRRIGTGEQETPIEQRLVPLTIPPPEWRFSGDDLESVGLASDQLGYPAVAFQIAPQKAIAFGDFTGAHINDGMAIVLNGEIATLATIQDRLPGSGIINGGATGFTQKEVKDLLTILRSGSLRIRPELLDRARVGATLGEDYVRRGAISCVVALLIVFVFMASIYRWLGMFSVIGLLINLLLLLGALAFLRATLTLPGIAGIVLTVGMAVDGNILIYERLREELKRGLKLVDAASAAFKRATVTIIDSNLTTLISGVILYKFGSGPIRGFATTLCIGILTTLFTVIVVTQILFYFDIRRGRKSYRMLNLIKGRNIRFLDWTRIPIGASILFLIVSLGLFARLPDQQKLGIDFLGGFTMTVATEEPQPIAKMRELVQRVPGTIGRSAEVKEILESGRRDAGYTRFRITYKLTEEEAQYAAESRAAQSSGLTGEREIREALASVLVHDAIRVGVSPAVDGCAVTGELRFEHSHPQADITLALQQAGLRNGLIVEPLDDRSGSYRFECRADSGSEQSAILASVRAQFEGRVDSRANPYSLVQAVPETALVGAAAGIELRDAAVKAILLGLLATVLYLRVRFAEYSYGIAVVVTLCFDLLVTLGVIAVASWTGFVQCEVDLAMIAGFLTIIGYSQNDKIVLFDRVRENRPIVKKSYREMVNLSINDTLGRTLLTGTTLILALLALFLFNFGTRNVLEGFSFIMLVGVVTGTWSTIFVAAPVLVWLENRKARKRAENVTIEATVEGSQAS